MNIFISQTDIFQNEIQNIIREQLFTKLNINQYNILMNWFIDILNLIFVLFHIEQKQKFEEQLRRNNYRDLIGLFLLLLPYIQNINELKTVISLEELYIRKEEDVDINVSSPKYVFTNMQYNRCLRKPLQEVKFNMIFLEDNYNLLKMTLYEVTNKMYVNWTNLVPMTLDNYKQSKIYQETEKYFNQNELDEWTIKSNELPKEYLQIGTIYETICNQLYIQIVNIKWLLYDYDLTNKNIVDLSIRKRSSGNIKTLIKILYPDNKNDNIINLEKAWSGIFWSNLSKEEQNVLNVEWNNFKSNSEYREIIKAITLGFSRYQENRPELFNYVPLPKKDKLQRYQFTEKEIQISINSIPIVEIYEFLRSSIHKFKGTIYYHILYGELKYLTEKTDDTNKISLLPKYIYNFAKSFSHLKKDFTLLPSRWKSLDDTNKNEIKSRLKKNNSQSWFSIRGNIKKIYNISNLNDINEINQKIYNLCMDNLIDIVFHCLIISGTISVFTLDETTPKSFNNGFYYVNNKKYGDLETFDSSDKYEIKSFLQFIEDLKTKKFTKNAWIDMYAMNWVSQISFFHRYINNRIIFATGGTGVGKSTQLPKLFLYAVKAIDLKDDGKVICSQPRKKPTFDNATRIADEMGIPILKSKEKTDYILNNINIQFQNHDEKFPPSSDEKRERILNPTLKIVTDKILLNNINNPLYKTIVEQKNQKKFINRNIYDIVIVDESHEHNENMDMILTLMKRVLYYNNDCKLVIISATMDDDEPIYRRFYRDINDNMMYPLNINLKNHNLDRINVDRRLHISIPGETRRYKITTNYSEKELENDQERNDKIIEQINQIFTRGNVGDILIFKPGQKEIKKCVELLNQVMPNDVYTVPYYGELSKEKRDMVENIHKIKNNIHIDRKVSFEDIGDINELYEGTNNYTHVIIVATNIAEASITIDTLTDVIDDGLQKVNTYYPDLNGSILKNDKISELQRLQREGRVGRTREGNVFYLYPNNARKNVRNNYKICINDITDLLFSLLKQNNDELIFNVKNNPNKNNVKNAIMNNEYLYGIEKIMRRQYLILDEAFNYIGKNEHYDYQNSEEVENQYLNNYDYNTLCDIEGKFYIIHPNELQITRNILGDIINPVSDDRISKFYERLSDWFLILQEQNGKTYYKTDYGKEVEKMFKLFFSLEKNGMQLAITTIFSKIYNCFDDVIKIITMIQTAYVIDKIYDSKCFKNQKSDLLLLLDKMNETKQPYNTMIQYQNNLQIITSEQQKINNIMNNISQLLDINKMKTQVYDKYNSITLAFLHGFGHNLVKKITSTKYYVPVKYPIKANIKYIQRKNTCLSDLFIQNYLLYFNIRINDSDDIANSNISILHYVEPELLQHISYQINLRKYVQTIQKYIAENMEVKIVIPFEKTRNVLIGDMKRICDNNDILIFSKVSPNAPQIIYNIYEDNKKYIQKGGGRKYKIVY